MNFLLFPLYGNDKKPFVAALRIEPRSITFFAEERVYVESPGNVFMALRTFCLNLQLICLALTRKLRGPRYENAKLS